MIVSIPLAKAIRAVISELTAKPHLWGPSHLGPMLREHLPTPASRFMYEMRDALGVRGFGSLKDWSDGLTAAEVVKELSRLLEAP